MLYRFTAIRSQPPSLHLSASRSRQVVDQGFEDVEALVLLERHEPGFWADTLAPLGFKKGHKLKLVGFLKDQGLIADA